MPHTTRDDPRSNVLVVCSWMRDLSELAGSLRDARVRARIVRRDFEAAVYSALSLEKFAVAIYIDTPGLPLEAVERAIRSLAPRLPLLVIDVLAQAGPRVAQVLQERLS